MTTRRDDKLILTFRKSCGPGQLSRYNDWLRTRRSGHRIPVETRFSKPVETGPGAHPAPYAVDTGSFSEVNDWGMALTTYPINRQG
jgi:hypothetical protein